MATKTTKGVALKTDKTGKTKVVPSTAGKTVPQQIAAKKRQRVVPPAKAGRAR